MSTKVLLLLLVITMATACQSLDTPGILGPSGRKLSKAIAELIPLELDGVRQYVLIRGNNTANPILLRIHGGPGQPEIAAEVLNRDLEKDFVVVEWDQRGSGKSTLDDAGYQRLSLSEIVDDTLALARYLKQRFGTPILLMGHSWGSIVGLRAIENQPQLFKGFISTGQIVNYAKGSQITYDAMVQISTHRHDTESQNMLTRLGPPPYSNDKNRQEYLNLIERLGVSWHATRPLDRIGLMIGSPEYSWPEKLSYTGEAQKSFRALFPDLLATNLEAHRSYNDPIFFILGRWDRLAPHELADSYLSTISAPMKGIVWFENSAHFPQYEEPKRFDTAVLDLWKQIQAGHR